MFVQAALLQLDHSLALYKRKQSFRRWQLALQPPDTRGFVNFVGAIQDLQVPAACFRGMQFNPLFGG